MGPNQMNMGVVSKLKLSLVRNCFIESDVWQDTFSRC